ncbi:MAG TPA: DUF748 domain-containing protein [Clostridiales bacterium]|nr:DUF748 domain-containing protein [Clostridiales bacterium]HQP69484.1 DUF748 domain-containing protein [Clostridiales bacterium]
MKNILKNKTLKNPIFWIVSLYVFYLLTAAFLLPYIAKKKAVEFVKTEYGRDLDIEKIYFNPFTLKVTVKNLVFHETDGGIFVKWDEFGINPALFPLVKKNIVIQDVYITTSDINIVRMKDGEFNFSSLIKEDKEEKPEQTEEKSSWKFTIESLRLNNVGFYYKDFTYSPEFRLDLLNISIDTKNIVFGGPEESKTKLNFDFQNGGSFALEGDFIIDPMKADFNIKLKDMNLTSFNTIMQSVSEIQFKNGLFDIDVNILLKDNLAKNRPDFSLNGIAGLSDIELSELKSDSMLLKFSNLKTDIRTMSFDPFVLDINEIRLDKLYAGVTRSSDGKINIAQAFVKENEAVQTADSVSVENTEKSAENIPDIRIRKVILADNTVDYSDMSTPEPFYTNVNAFNFTADNIRLFAPDSSGFDMTFRISESGENRIAGTFRHEPLYVRAVTSLRNIDLTPANSFMPDSYMIKLTSATLSSEIKTTYDSAAKKSKLKAGGDIFFENFAFTDSTGKNILSWKEISVNDGKFELDPLKSRVSLIKLKDLHSDIIISKNKELNLAAAFGSKTAGADSPENEKEKSAPADTVQTSNKKLDIIIKKISLENNSINFADFSLPFPFATNIEKINSTVNNIDLSSEERTNISFKGIADKSGTASIKGDMFLLEPLKNSQMNIDFEKISLIQYSPYSAKYVGNFINSGSLSLYVRYVIQNSMLSSEDKLIIDKITFGKEFDSYDKIHLPIKLAIALLKDKNGVIDFDIEVKGNLADPEINTGSLIWQALKKVLTSVATSPIRFLANSLGLKDAESYEFVEFPLGETVLPETEIKKLDELSKALREKPDLKLNVTGLASRKFDRVTIQDRKLRKQVLEENKSPYDSLNTFERKNILEKMLMRIDTAVSIDSIRTIYTKKDKKTVSFDTLKYNSKLFSMNRSRQNTDDIEIIVLTTERANAVKSHLTARDSVAEEQIIIMPGELIDDDKIKTVKTKLNIELK